MTHFNKDGLTGPGSREPQLMHMVSVSGLLAGCSYSPAVNVKLSFVKMCNTTTNISFTFLTNASSAITKYIMLSQMSDIRLTKISLCLSVISD